MVKKTISSYQIEIPKIVIFEANKNQSLQRLFGIFLINEDSSFFTHLKQIKTKIYKNYVAYLIYFLIQKSQLQTCMKVDIIQSLYLNQPSNVKFMQENIFINTKLFYYLQ